MGSFGIPSSGFEYQNINNNQDKMNEHLITQKFLKTFFDKDIHNVAPNLVTHNMNLEFINYGDTQLVYVLTTQNGYYTVLVGQPATPFKQVEEEFNNLLMLSEKFPNLVVKPIYYYTNGIREMYISPYIMQARCVAIQEIGWGVYIPEPYYRFEKFSSIEQDFVNTSIIANLVRLYDAENQRGLASCKIGGGDFILEKEWSFNNKSIENTLKYMKLIAARQMINISFQSYIDKLKIEFKLNTYYRNSEDRDTSVLINHKSRVEMTDSEIEKGIKLGLKLRN